MVDQIVKITDHQAKAFARLPDKFRDLEQLYPAFWREGLCTGWEGLIYSLVEPAQQLEDIMFSMLAALDLSSAAGVQLDRIGQIVGQPRNGLEDPEYLIQIQAQIAENNSDGTGNNVLNIASQILGSDAALLSLREMFPAKMLLDVGIEHALVVTEDNNELTIYDAGMSNPYLITLEPGKKPASELAAVITDAFLDQFGLTVPVTFDTITLAFTIGLTGSTGSIVFGSAASLYGFESFGFVSDDTVAGWGVMDAGGDTLGGGVYDTFDNGSFFSTDITGIATEAVLADAIQIQEAVLGAKAAGVGLGIDVVLVDNYFGVDSDSDAVGFGSLVGGVTIGGGNYTSLNI